MEKNNSSNSSICGKIRQALASSPAFRAIHRIKYYHQEPRPVIIDSNSPSSLPSHLAKNTAIRTKPSLPQHLKVNTEGADSTPTSMGNGNSTASMVHGRAAKVASPRVGNSERAAKVAAKVEPEPRYVPRQGKPSTKTQVVGFPTNIGMGQGRGQVIRAAAFKGEDNGKPKAETPGPLKGQHGLGMHSEQQGKKSLDINDTFTEYIQRAKYKIRTVSNIGRGQSNPAPDEANGADKNENQKDHFSDFIQLTKKKLRTTSSIGKTSSLKRG